MADRLHLPDGRPAPDAAPLEDILDHGDLTKMRQALVQGHSVSLGPNGQVYVHQDLDGAWNSHSQAFIESKLGDMKGFIARGFSVEINPRGVVNARSADGKFEYHSDLHPDPMGTDREYIRDAVKSGANVAILPDGTVQVTHDGAPPRPYADYVDRVMAQLDSEVNTGRLGQQASEGNAFVITADGDITNFHYQQGPQSTPAIRFPLPGEPDPLAAANGTAPGTGDVGTPGAVADATDAAALADPFDTSGAAASGTAGTAGTDPAADVGDGAAAAGLPGGGQAAVPVDDMTTVDPAGAGDVRDGTWSAIAVGSPDAGNPALVAGDPALVAGDDPLGQAPIENAASGDDTSYEPAYDMAGSTQSDPLDVGASAPADAGGLYADGDHADAVNGYDETTTTDVSYADYAGPADGDVAMTTAADTSSDSGFSDDSYSDATDLAPGGSSDLDYG